MTSKILFVERKRSHFVSIEKVFRNVAGAISDDQFKTGFQQVPYSNNFSSILKNLMFFNPEAADVYHITGHIHYMTFRLPRDRTVLTIHDLAFLHTRKGLRRYLLKKLLLDWPLKRSKFVTTVSEFTKREILSWNKMRPEQVTVIENPIGKHLKRRSPTKFNESMPTILQVGTMENKNVVRLIWAVRGLKCKLRIIGPLNDPIRHALAEVGVNCENVECLDDMEMQDEYSSADIVAFCSTYEGFGLPIVEAQTVGVPVITSNLSPMKEVAGEGSVLVDPFNIEEIRAAIILLIGDAAKRDELVRKGAANAKRFNREVVAQKYCEIYSAIIDATDTSDLPLR